MTDTDKLTEREEMEALLPWYVTGKLDRADADRVAAYLAGHVDMARQLGLIQEERAVAEDAHGALRGPPPDALGRFMQSIGEAAPQAGASERLRASQTGLLLRAWRAAAEFFAAPSPGAVRWAAMAAAVVLVVQSTVIVTLALRPTRERGSEASGGYHTASGKETPAESGAVFLLAFARNATAPAITKFLGEFDAVIVDGPKPGGMYKIVVRGNAMDSKALLKRISERKDIVELVLPSGS